MLYAWEKEGGGGGFKRSRVFGQRKPCLCPLSWRAKMSPRSKPCSIASLCGVAKVRTNQGGYITQSGEVSGFGLP